MRKLFLVAILCISLGLVACSSPEADELVEYHNSYVETVNPKANQMDAELEKLSMIADPEEAFEFQNENIIPIAEEIIEYIESNEPETDVVKELHDLRLEQMNGWIEGFELRNGAMEKAAEMADEQEINELVQQSDEKFMETAEKAQIADERLVEMAEEHNVELEEE
ncbi:hypothetical protein J2Z83_003571 [Virgibacillus natechei]|uniref:Lipoprotein n=1 Tax=Virgibacillus natechei TaxID=1216297 RepID=A0ABS4IKE6_9BACI|nr:hypothetical protein [Virgibacillus natechei]MBP1971432.1 hypothetical protein [Virgibacillus natechei]UZD13802.1 hypothetical protein OLD84_04420 [Virgibacillus natechei]